MVAIDGEIQGIYYLYRARGNVHIRIVQLGAARTNALAMSNPKEKNNRDSSS